MIFSYSFGNEVYYDTDINNWKFIDGVENTIDSYQKRICPSCGLNPTNDGQDPCISNLKGVKYACCGHGVEDSQGYPGYIMFDNRETIRFNSLEELHKYVKDNNLWDLK